MDTPRANSTFEQRLKTGIAHHQARRFAEAEAIYRPLLAEQPEHAGLLNLLGALHGQMNSLDLAEDFLRRAIRANPDFAEVHINLGFIHQRKGRLGEAIASHREAVRLRPDYAGAHNNLGMALKQAGQIDAAIASHQQAVRLRPEDHKFQNNLGIALRAGRRFDEAIESYRRAIRLKADFAEAHNNLGNALNDRGRVDEAIAAYRQAIRFMPDYADALSNLGESLKNIGELDAAVASHRAAIRARPDYPRAHSNLIFTLYYHPEYDDKMILEELRRWNVKHAEPLKKLIQPHGNDRNPDRRLRIGYVSPDFREHVVGQNLLPLLREHNRGQTEIFCYSDSFRPDAVTEELQRHADAWRDITGQLDSQVAALIRQDRIDILVDLSAHSAQNRLTVFALKPAPVQVTYLAYCCSTGLATMDYRLSDPHLDPPGTDLSVYTEKTIRLPETYWCYSSDRPTPDPSSPPVLSAGYITFGCLNNFAKVTPALDLWARILQAIPQSRLIIHSNPGSHLNRVRDRFAKNGVSPDRIEFIPKQLWPDYMATYSRIDIALDPLPWGGGITTCDALWMGVPVVTVIGRTPVGRGGASILANIGVAELIAKTPEQYVQIAVELANDLPRLTELRKILRTKMQSSPLKDASRFARTIEAAFRQMWKESLARVG